MARTLKGNLTGRAGAEERRELRDEIAKPPSEPTNEPQQERILPFLGALAAEIISLSSKEYFEQWKAETIDFQTMNYREVVSRYEHEIADLKELWS